MDNCRYSLKNCPNNEEKKKWRRIFTIIEVVFGLFKVGWAIFGIVVLANMPWKNCEKILFGSLVTSIANNIVISLLSFIVLICEEGS